jgi:hypothetical protein
METGSLLLGLILGSIGMGYCLYGKKRGHLVAFGSGVGLIILPYAITNNALLIALALVIMLLPRFFKF